MEPLPGSRGLTTTVTAAGTATLSVRPGGVYPWKVTQVSTELSVFPSGATCSLRRNGYQVTPLVASGGNASGDPPTYLRPEDEMTIEWAGCTPGSLAKALVQYEVVTQ